MWFHETFLCFENLEVLRIASRFITLIGEEKKTSIIYELLTTWFHEFQISQIDQSDCWTDKK